MYNIYRKTANTASFERKKTYCILPPSPLYLPSTKIAWFICCLSSTIKRG